MRHLSSYCSSVYHVRHLIGHIVLVDSLSVISTRHSWSLNWINKSVIQQDLLSDDDKILILTTNDCVCVVSLGL